MKGKLAALLTLLALLAACGKMTSVNAPREKEGISLVENAHYDSESKIRYMVSNDNTHVYLRFDTDNYATIMRVRKLGAIVRFDTKGKQKGTHWLKYPVYETEDTEKIGAGDPNALPGGMLRSSLFPPTTTAIWTVGEVSKNVDLGLNTEGFVYNIGIDDKDVLNYMVGIPFKLLGAQRPEDLATLNMELEIPSPDVKGSASSSSSSSPMPGGMNGGMPGSMNSGNPGSPGSMSGPLPTGGMMSSGGVSGGTPAIRIWMQVKMSPSAAL